VWNVKEAQVKFRITGHTDHVWTLALLSNGLLASGSSDQYIIVWDYRNGEEKMKLKGHNGIVNTLTWTPGKTLISGSSDRAVIVWDFNNEELKQAVGMRQVEEGKEWRVV
jgi:WD40 repeat protein